MMSSGSIWQLQLLVVAVLVCIVADMDVSHAQTVEKAHTTDCSKWSRPRDCAPWGLNSKEISPAFKYDFDDPLQECLGVVNNFYYFKLVNFAQDVETSVLFRALKGVAEGMWNAWAHFHPTATDTLGMLANDPSRRMPADQHNIVNKNIAIAYTLTRLTAHLLPKALKEAQDVLTTLMLSTNWLTGLETYTNTSTPEGIGNLVAQELIEHLKQDGWNSEGDLSPRNPFPFADYTGYTPVNTEFDITKPTRYQPLMETDMNGYFFKQSHTTPQLRSPRVKPWALKRSWVDARQAPEPWNPITQGEDFMKWYQGNVSLVLNTSATLNTTQKLIAEFWDNKILSMGGFERWFAWKKNWCHDDFVQYEQLSSCLHDATILAWKEKMRIDAIRPASAIRYLQTMGLLPRTVTAWGGAAHDFKPANINPFSWASYLRTMPHSEFPSGTSCACTVWGEWTKLFQNGDERLDLPLTWDKGCSSIEQGVTPPSKLTYTFPTISEAHKICSQSRIWAGVHFQSSIDGGIHLCSGIAKKCYSKVKRLLKGNPY